MLIDICWHLSQIPAYVSYISVHITYMLAQYIQYHTSTQISFLLSATPNLSYSAYVLNFQTPLPLLRRLAWLTRCPTSPPVRMYIANLLLFFSSLSVYVSSLLRRYLSTFFFSYGFSSFYSIYFFSSVILFILFLLFLLLLYLFFLFFYFIYFFYPFTSVFLFFSHILYISYSFFSFFLGGGASLELLEGKVLPGVAALNEK